MSEQDKSSRAVIRQIDTLLEEDDLSTRSGLRLAFSAMRDAIEFMSSANDRMDTVEKKVEEIWHSYKIISWIGGVIGTSIIVLLWALLTGQAHLHFGP